jgi:hypothetical protein
MRTHLLGCHTDQAFRKYAALVAKLADQMKGLPGRSARGAEAQIARRGLPDTQDS